MQFSRPLTRSPNVTTTLHRDEFSGCRRHDRGLSWGRSRAVPIVYRAQGHAANGSSRHQDRRSAQHVPVGRVRPNCALGADVFSEHQRPSDGHAGMAAPVYFYPRCIFSAASCLAVAARYGTPSRSSHGSPGRSRTAPSSWKCRFTLSFAEAVGLNGERLRLTLHYGSDCGDLVSPGVCGPLAVSKLTGVPAPRRLGGGGSPEGPPRSAGTAQRLHAATPIRHPAGPSGTRSGIHQTT